MKISRFILIICLFTVSYMLLGCSKGAPAIKASSIDSDGGGDTGSPATPPPVSDTVPLSLTLSTKYDETTYNYPLIFNETGTKFCQATIATPVVTCTVAVPEARLYYSSISFAYAWMPTSCKLLTFQPYYYLGSTAAGYRRPGALQDTDCSTSPIPVDCFGGAAPDLVPDFPNNVALIHFPDETNLTTALSKVLKLTSAFSKKYLVNRHSVNDLAPAKEGLGYATGTLGNNYGGGTVGDGLIAGTYVNYKFSCADDWQEPQTYIINLKIKDIDYPTSGFNHRATWSAVP